VLWGSPGNGRSRAWAGRQQQGGRRSCVQHCGHAPWECPVQPSPSRIGGSRPCALTRGCSLRDVSGVTEPNEVSGTRGSQGEWLPAPVTLAPPAGAEAGSVGAMGAAGGMVPAHSTGHPGLDQARIPAALSQAGNLAAGWPLRDFIELGPLPTSVPCARYHARQIIWEWRLTPLSETVELVVDELVTNAVSASRSLDWPSPVRMWLLSDRAIVLVLVWDANPEPPVLIDPEDDAEGGRGLVLVEALSTQWDWYGGPGAGGKLVYALITA
jgi:hypothetical protein